MKNRIIVSASWITIIVIGIFNFGYFVNYFFSSTKGEYTEENRPFQNKNHTFLKTKVRFDKSLAVDSALQSKSQWNKLLGFNHVLLETKGIEDVNSIGWVWRQQGDIIELSPYFYVNGAILKDSKIYRHEVAKEIQLSIKVDKIKKECHFFLEEKLFWTGKFYSEDLENEFSFPFIEENNLKSNEIRVGFSEITIL